jgi:hypothetical protein
MTYYNVWVINKNRWTNGGIKIGSSIQDPLHPYPLTYEEAVDGAGHAGFCPTDRGILFEIREIADDGVSPGPMWECPPIGSPTVATQSPAKSGMFCSICGEFYHYAVPNRESKLVCYSCRSSGK